MYIVNNLLLRAQVPGEGHGNLLSVLLPGESHGEENPMERRLAGYGPLGLKESDTIEVT